VAALPRPAGRDLTRDEARAYAAAVAERPELWRRLVRHDPEARVFTLLERDDHVETWVICWMPGHDTGFHDHDLSSGAVTVIQGQVREHRLRMGGEAASRLVPTGGFFEFTSSDIHRVTHEGDEPAVTLHVYSPPLRRMGRYLIEPEGALQRHPLGHDEELRPLDAV
jgi:predicted metal-dependent enzyme (double-stranded beta helix superfamily)